MSDVFPLSYKISLTPDLKRFRFAGRVEIEFSAERATNRIILNLLDIAVWKSEVKLQGHYQRCGFQVDPRAEVLTIILPQKMSGGILVAITYDGKINDQMAGFYRSRYRVGDEERYMAVTQFQESDARRAFPCVDHPRKKAVFQVEMIIDDHLTAVSNTDILNQEALPGGKIRVIFEKTPLMSTYLVFFGIGDFAVRRDRVDERIRAVMLPGTESYLDFGLAFGRKALRYSEDYYGIPYPLSKLDLIAVPDFAFGAMENWGAMTFRENLLHYDPEITSGAAQERICEVIAHEIAHQWFGNLVTPCDWKYIWLNESFATYFGYGVVDHTYPEWRIWEQFLYGQTETAMKRDALKETFAVRIPGGEHVVINAATAPIIYSKAGGLLRQINAFIGEAGFRKGLRRYLKKYAYGDTASHHLWESLESVSDRPVTRMMTAWVNQPGFPLVEVRRQEDTLVLYQRRFTYLSCADDSLWPIPITMTLFTQDGQTRKLDLLLEDRSASVAVGKEVAAYKLNVDQTGFYRVKYPPEDLGKLGGLIRSGGLSAIDRWGIQNDLFARLGGGEVTCADYCDFLEYYQAEKAPLPLLGIAENLFRLCLILEGENKNRARRTGKAHVEKILSHFGRTPNPEEAHPVAALRDRVLWYAVLFGIDQAVDFITDQFKRLMGGASVHRDILKSVMRGGAHIGNDEAFTWLKNRLEISAYEHERITILNALGSFSDPSVIQTALDYVLERVPERNKFIPIVSAASNPAAIPLMWPWYQSRLNTLERFHPILYERVIESIVPISGMGAEDAVKTFFKAYIDANPVTADVSKLSLENLAINLRIRGLNA